MDYCKEHLYELSSQPAWSSTKLHVVKWRKTGPIILICQRSMSFLQLYVHVPNWNYVGSLIWRQASSLAVRFNMVLTTKRPGQLLFWHFKSACYLENAPKSVHQPIKECNTFIFQIYNLIHKMTLVVTKSKLT